MATGKKTRKTAKRTRKKKVEPSSRGLVPSELTAGDRPAEARALARAIEKDGGSVLASYRDPIGGSWQLLAGLPLDLVQPTPFQRDLSEAHVKRLTDVIDKLDRFLDPIITVRTDEGVYWTPNGHHRTAAVRALGGRSIVSLVLPDRDTAYRILALNTEKAHNLREKSLEVIRMARALADAGGGAEKDYVLEFEEAPFLTLGICYEKRGRFSGGAYHPILKRIDAFLDTPLRAALRVRDDRAARVLELDDAVVEAVGALKERGFRSPYLKAFVVARVNPLRFKRGATGEFDEIVGKMLASAERFDPAKVKADQLAASSGPPED